MFIKTQDTTWYLYNYTNDNKILEHEFFNLSDTDKVEIETLNEISKNELIIKPIATLYLKNNKSKIKFKNKSRIIDNEIRNKIGNIYLQYKEIYNKNL